MEEVKDFNSVDLPFVKEYLRIEEDYTDEDVFLKTCLISGKSYIINYLGYSENVPWEATIALLTLISHWYNTRSITNEGETKRELPYVFEGLLSQSRDWKAGLE